MVSGIKWTRHGNKKRTQDFDGWRISRRLAKVTWKFENDIREGGVFNDTKKAGLIYEKEADPIRSAESLRKNRRGEVGNYVAIKNQFDQNDTHKRSAVRRRRVSFHSRRLLRLSFLRLLPNDVTINFVNSVNAKVYIKRSKRDVSFAESFPVYPQRESLYNADGVIDIDIDEYLW